MTWRLFPRASAAINAAVFTARTRGLSQEHGGNIAKEKKEGKTGNFVCSPFSILLVFAVAMRGARGRTFEEMERLLPLRGLPAVLRLTTHSTTTESGPADTEAAAEQGMREDTRTELDIVSRMYVDSALESNMYFRAFKEELWQESSKGHGQEAQLPVQLIDCTKAAETAKEINDFVRKTTKGHITDLVSADVITRATRLLLVSAAFFKGPWFKPFDVQETKKGTFHAIQAWSEGTAQLGSSKENHGREKEGDAGGSDTAQARDRQPLLVEQNVDMMHVRLEAPTPFFFTVDDQVTAVGLPYQDANYVLYVVQANDPKNFDKLMRYKSEKSSPESFPTVEDVVRSMHANRERAEEAEVHLSLPKFKLKAADNHLDLIPLFRRLLQIRAPFDRDLADFSGISGDQSLLMSTFIHQADIEVDEKGTVATAATLAAIALKMAFMHKERVELTINKPFAFQLRYHPPEDFAAQAGTPSSEGAAPPEAPVLGDYVLFTGCVTDASAAQH